jgi:tetraprenyl-beta-curcumene synthase
MQRWRKRAEQIPDPALRACALQALNTKRGNIEGAAAFAVLAPRPRRRVVIRAEVAFATLSDYLDTLCEQPSEDPIANGIQLHQAQLAALDRDLPWADYYAKHTRGNDGNYLRELVETCRSALDELPSYPQAAPAARRLAEHAGRFQSLNLTDTQGGHEQLAQWARREAIPGANLRWWETAAAANSTLGILALVAAAARSTLAADEAARIEQAYRPWVEALHTLLDSVVDESEDRATGQRSLVDYYASPEEAACRLSSIATDAIRSVARLDDAPEHAVVLAAMVGFYLYPAPASHTGKLVSASVLEALGFLAVPTVLMFRARHALRRLGRFTGPGALRRKSVDQRRCGCQPQREHAYRI